MLDIKKEVTVCNDRYDHYWRESQSSISPDSTALEMLTLTTAVDRVANFLQGLTVVISSCHTTAGEKRYQSQKEVELDDRSAESLRDWLIARYPLSRTDLARLKCIEENDCE